MAAAAESRHGGNHERPPRGLPRAPLPRWRPTLGRGNVRTYQNVVERASPLSDGARLGVWDLPEHEGRLKPISSVLARDVPLPGLGALALDPPGGSTSATSRGATGNMSLGARAAGVAR